MGDICYTMPGSVTIQLNKTRGRRDVLEVHFQRAGSGERQRAVKPLVDELAEMNVPPKLRNQITKELVEKVCLHLHFVPFRIMFCVADPCQRQLQQRHTGPRVREGDEREASTGQARSPGKVKGTCRGHVTVHEYMLI